MGLKSCEKCGESVDDAKAFCPECGNPFVSEEQREGSTEFDNYAGTINFSKSVYKMMLSEMELDTSKPTEVKKVQKVPLPPQKQDQQVIEISKDETGAKPLPAVPPIDKNIRSGKVIWIILALFFVLFLFFALGVAAYIYFVYFS